MPIERSRGSLAGCVIYLDSPIQNVAQHDALPRTARIPGLCDKENDKVTRRVSILPHYLIRRNLVAFANRLMQSFEWLVVTFVSYDGNDLLLSHLVGFSYLLVGPISISLSTT